MFCLIIFFSAYSQLLRIFRRLTAYVSCYDAGLVVLSAVWRNTFAELKEDGQASLTDAEETTTGTVLWRIAGTRLRSNVEGYKGYVHSCKEPI
jgi:hypothetical protein